MALLLLFLFALASSSVHAYECGTINVTGTWGFPLSTAQNCGWFIQFPPGTYAKMYLKAIDMVINDSVTIRYPITSLSQRSEAPLTFISNASYPIPFYIDVFLDLFNSSEMQIEIQIQLFPNNLGKNVQQTLLTGLNKPTEFVYFEDFQEGATYNLKTDSNMDCYGFRMYDIIYWWSFLNSVNGSVSVYIAEKPVALTGALVFNDYINYVKLVFPSTWYVPLNQRGETGTYWMSNDFPDQGMDGAVTIVGAKNGSTPFDVRAITTNNNFDVSNPAYITYLAGGVVGDHSNATRLYQNQLPLHVTGNLNTFYVTKGAGSVKITVTN